MHILTYRIILIWQKPKGYCYMFSAPYQ